ncbi:receptor-like protein Cf-9 homolog [Pistacia vera]|uniref:receptor-like protein Cf-9 homolog n=1 Tax=Pistacia vera TaxID=55513 RepID=UPI001262E11F|nr:receptor-like protein Cf-9 homolog [Pistacia vera]
MVFHLNPFLIILRETPGKRVVIAAYGTVSLVVASQANFSGLLPTEIFHQSELVSIDLSGSDTLQFPDLSQRVFSKHLQNLTKLSYLHLHDVDMSSVAASSFKNLSSTLISLDLNDTAQQGKFLEDVFHHPLLQWLNLSNNEKLTCNLRKSN